MYSSPLPAADCSDCEARGGGADNKSFVHVCVCVLWFEGDNGNDRGGGPGCMIGVRTTSTKLMRTTRSRGVTRTLSAFDLVTVVVAPEKKILHPTRSSSWRSSSSSS